MSELLTLDDGTVIDLETGEVVEEGAKAADPSEYLAYMAIQFNEAKEQASAWESQRKALSRVCEELANKQGVPSFEVGPLKFTRYSGYTGKKSNAALALKAVEAEVITHDDVADLLISAARDLDTKAVEAWIEERPAETRKVLRALLINEYEVSGHMRSSVAKKDGKKAIAPKPEPVEAAS